MRLPASKRPASSVMIHGKFNNKPTSRCRRILAAANQTRASTTTLERRMTFATLEDGRGVMWHKLVKDTLLNTSGDHPEKLWDCKATSQSLT